MLHFSLVRQQRFALLLIWWSRAGISLAPDQGPATLQQKYTDEQTDRGQTDRWSRTHLYHISILCLQFNTTSHNKKMQALHCNIHPPSWSATARSSCETTPGMMYASLPAVRCLIRSTVLGLYSSTEERAIRCRENVPACSGVTKCTLSIAPSPPCPMASRLP